MMQRRNYIWLVPLALMISFPVWRMPIAAFLTPRGGYDPAYANLKSDVHNFFMKTVTIFEHKNARKTAIVKAEKAYSSPKPDEYILEIVDSDIFNQSGEATHIVAKRGIFNTATNLLTLIDNVVVDKKLDNQQLYSDLLYYDDRKRTVNCPGKTRLVGEDVEINGSSFDYGIEDGKYEIGGRVKCLINGFSNPSSPGTPSLQSPAPPPASAH
jgi:LPS export ABC transporter protein LptC